MSRVRVYGRLTGDNREVSIGGRSRNEYIESWINFDAGKKKEYTEAITTSVRYNDITGKITVNIDYEKALQIPEEFIEIRVNGQLVKNNRDMIKMILKGE